MANDRSPLTTNGFTLLEVILSLAILASMTGAVSMLLKNSTTLKESISESGNVNHRLQFAISKIADDLAHAFMVKKTDFDRRTKAIFKIDKSNYGDKLSLTTFTHRPRRRHSKESDLTYVVYEVRKDDEANGMTHLYRGEAKRVPENFRQQLEMVVLARAIKSLKFTPWDGARWIDDRWNSNRSVYRHRIPHMVRVELEAFEVEERERGDSEEGSSVAVKTIVFNHFATNFSQPKSVTGPVRWF